MEYNKTKEFMKKLRDLQEVQNATMDRLFNQLTAMENTLAESISNFNRTIGKIEKI